VQNKKQLKLGLFAGASTGIFWGVPFLAPQILKGYSSFEIAFGRFFFFGLMGIFFAKRGFAILKSLSLRERVWVFLLSACGFWLYSSILFWSIQKTDGILSSLVLGMLPVTIPLFTPGRRSGGMGFYGGLFLIATGLFILLGGAGVGEVRSLTPDRVPGVIGLFVCLSMWTGFSISNSRFLQRRREISRRDFSSLMGLISLASMVPLLFVSVDFTEWSGRESLPIYVAVSAVLGIGCSWFANWLWNIASVYFPSEISGTLLVFETIFGVIYTLVFQRRLPETGELLATLLCLIGVPLAVVSQIRIENKA